MRRPVWVVPLEPVEWKGRGDVCHGVVPLVNLSAELQLGVSHLQGGDLPAAWAVFDRLLRTDPDFAPLYYRMGRAWFDAHQVDWAEGAFRQLAAAFPHDAEPRFRLATVLQTQDRLAEADRCYADAAHLASRPGLGMVRALLLPAIPSSDREIDQVRERMAGRLSQLQTDGWRLADPWIDVDTVPFHLAYHGRDDRPLMEQMAAVYRTACPELAFAAPSVHRPRQAGRRLKVGFVSRFFGHHVVSAFFADLIARLPADRIEAVAIQVDDPQAPLPPRAVDGLPLVGLREPSLDGLRRQLAEAAFDVLVYPDIGMEPITYFLAHARLAPVQIVMGGHPVTTGLPSVDYFLSTRGFEPPDGALHYTERLLSLPMPPAWMRRPAVPGASAGGRFAHVADERWYVCPQSLFKLQPMMDEAFAGILRQDAGGRLILIAGSDASQARRWLARFRQGYGDVVDRVRFLPRLPYAEYQQLLQSADAVLDPFPFNGGHSTYTACALGVAPVTLRGTFMRGRVTAGVLDRLGMPETIAKDVADYVRLAVRMAQERDWRHQISRRLLGEAGVLFEQDEAVTLFATVLLATAEAAVRGERLTDVALASVLG